MIKSIRWRPLTFFTFAVAVLAATPARSQPTETDAVSAMHRAVSFFREHASASGGYVYTMSADLAKREGEGVVGNTTAWIEPPSTPSVGMAYLDAFRLTGDSVLLDAARETANALRRGQLQSGGWDNKIEFDPMTRRKYAYRVEGTRSGNLRNTTTFDDDKSQSVVRFLMQLDKELEFKDSKLHEVVTYALEAVLATQYPCGAWPQRFTVAADPNDFPVLKASFPETWPRKFTGAKYTAHYTLNDDTITDLIVTLLDAWEVYGDKRYFDAAQKGGDFFLLSQLPEPQPGWAQQYDRKMHPAWARKFEPPAVSGGESQGVMRTLLRLYRRTAATSKDAARFLEPLPRTIAFYRRSLRADGRLARFYEIGTNKPLYFTRDYQLSYSDDDMPTHYGFIVSSKLDQIEAELEKVGKMPKDQLWKPKRTRVPKQSGGLSKRAAQLITNLDDRGAWIEVGRLRYHDEDDPTRHIIRSDTFAKNLHTLAEFIAAHRN